MRRLALLLPFVLAACGPRSPSPLSPAARDAETRGEIALGAFLPLSGPEAAFGAEAKAGMELAVETINASGGVKGQKLRLFFEDDGSRTADATRAAATLVDKQHVVALLGDVSSERSVAAGIVAEARHVPMISPSATAPEVTFGRSFVFRACFSDPQQAAAAARYAREAMGAKTAALLHDPSDPASATLSLVFLRAFEAGGGKVIARGAVADDAPEPELRAALTSARDADVVYVPLRAEGVVSLAARAHAAGSSTARWLGGDGWDAASLLGGAKDLGGARFVTHYAADLPSARSLEASFRARFGRGPTSLAAEAYDAVRLLADALARTDGEGGKALQNALEATSGFPSSTGPFAFDAHHDAQKPIVVLGVRDGALFLAGTAQP